MERTIGLEISSLSLSDPSWEKDFSFSLFDYGGQKRFHITHDRFFEGSISIFVIVISLKDQERMRSEEEELERIEEEVLYWKKFIASSVSQGELLSFFFHSFCLE